LGAIKVPLEREKGGDGEGGRGRAVGRERGWAERAASPTADNCQNAKACAKIFFLLSRLFFFISKFINFADSPSLKKTIIKVN
jgi:hypothetical protein